MTDPKCPQCHGEGWLTVINDDGSSYVTPCACSKQVETDALLRFARIPPRYEHCTLDNFIVHAPSDEKALKACRSFVDDYPRVKAGLLIVGKCGVGKTHLAVGVLKAIGEKNHRVIFADSRELISEIRSSFDQNSNINSRQLIRKVAATGLLLLDDLGAYHLTEWVKDTFADIITRRFNNRLPIILTTNYPDKATKKQRETLEERIGYRLRSRLYEMCRLVKISGDDNRKEIISPGYDDY